MKKLLLTLLIGSTLAISTSCPTLADTPKTESTLRISNNQVYKIGDVMTNSQVESSDKILSEHPEYQCYALKNPNFRYGGPAPALSDYYIDRISDSNGTIENIKYVQSKTTKDFNGIIRVETLEIGYGKDFAKFDGVDLGSSDKIKIVPLDLDGDRRIDAFRNIWELNADSGLFETFSVSTNPPTNTIRDSIFIK